MRKTTDREKGNIYCVTLNLKSLDKIFNLITNISLF